MLDPGYTIDAVEAIGTFTPPPGFIGPKGEQIDALYATTWARTYVKLYEWLVHSGVPVNSDSRGHQFFTELSTVLAKDDGSQIRSSWNGKHTWWRELPTGEKSNDLGFYGEVLAVLNRYP